MGHRFMRAQMIRLGRLLNMMYRPSEIAEEIELTTETIVRHCLAGGCPFERDKNGHIWIHGLSFAAWAREVNQKNRHKGVLEDGEGWCCKCKAVVKIIGPRLRHQGRYTKIYQGKCEGCGVRVNRAYAASAEVGGSPSGAPGASPSGVRSGGESPTGPRSA
jgi:hypothetical protein